MKSIQLIRFFSIASLLIFCFTVGCNPPTPKKKVAKKKGDATGIFNKTTTEVGEWDPGAGFEVVVEDGEDVNMINRNLKGLGAASDMLAKMKVQAALEQYRALEGHYPKTYDEFKNKFFKNWVKDLPMPRTTCEYQYDVDNHELLIVKKKQ